MVDAAVLFPPKLVRPNIGANSYHVEGIPIAGLIQPDDFSEQIAFRRLKQTLNILP